MAIDVFGVQLGLLDVIGLSLFFSLTLIYHVGYALYARKHPLTTVKGKIHLYRRTWIKRILDRKDYILAVQTIRNLMMSANFLATASLLALSLVFNILILGAPTDKLHPARPDLLPWQLFLLAGIFAFSFWEFLLSIRYLNQLSVLVAADPDLIDQVEGMDAVTWLTHLLNRATNRYTYGQRGFYFSTAVFAWIFSTWAFVLITAVIGLFFVAFLDFQQWKPPKALAKEGDVAV